MRGFVRLLQANAKGREHQPDEQNGHGRALECAPQHAFSLPRKRVFSVICVTLCGHSGLKPHRNAPDWPFPWAELPTATTESGWLQGQHQWPGLKAIGKVDRVRETASIPNRSRVPLNFVPRRNFCGVYSRHGFPKTNSPQRGQNVRSSYNAHSSSCHRTGHA